MEYEIINKKVEFKNPQLVLSNGKGNLGILPRAFIDNLISHFDELKSTKKDNYTSSELKETHEIIRKRHLAKAKVLKKEENMGFISIGAITIISFLILSFIIFMITGNIVGR